MNKKKNLDALNRERVVGQIVSYLEEKGEGIVVVYLFGSFNTEDEFSDIDLGIIVNDSMRDFLDFEIGLEAGLQKAVKYPVDVRVLNHAPISFCQNVIRFGRVIIDRDPNLRADFQGRVLKQYFDFSPFRRRYLKEVFNAPV